MRAPGGALAAALALGALLGGCAGTRERSGAPEPGGVPWREEGLASWYGQDFHGRRTASGERYNMYALTAAHKTLPLGTTVLVTDRRSGRSLRVRINDRGPFVAGRVIDLSYGAARRLGSASAGVVPVVLEATLPETAFAALGPAGAPGEPPALRGSFSVQAGSFSREANARGLRERLAPRYGTVRVLPFEDNRGSWWRVRVGAYPREEAARQAAARLESEGLPGFVVRED